MAGPTTDSWNNRVLAGRFHTLACILIAFVCLSIYANTLNTPFIFDDRHNIEENPFVRITHLSAKGLYDVGFKSPCPNRPLANITFALNYYFGRYDVAGYHVVNILIHLINGILVYVLAGLLYRRAAPPGQEERPAATPWGAPWMAVFAALIFAAHPIQTQSVTYIVQRMNSLAAMFYLGAFILYLKGREAEKGRDRWLLFLACFLSWLLALASKEIAVTLPVILLLYEWFFLQDLQSDWLKRNFKYFIGIAVILGLLAMIYLKGDPFEKIMATYRYRDFTLTERVLTQFRVVVLYMSLILYPHPSRLSLLHPTAPSLSLTGLLTTLLCFGVIAGFVAVAVLLARRQRLISFCILWFFVNLALESSIIGLELVYEHRLYLPMFGVAVMGPYLLFRVLWRRKKWAAPMILGVVIISLGTATYIRNGVWKDRITLWSDVIEKNADSPRGYNGLGLALYQQGRLEDAIHQYEKALRLDPEFGKAHINLGLALEGRGRLDEALGHYEKATRSSATRVTGLYNSGSVFLRQGRLDEAVAYLQRAVRLNPLNARAQNDLGIALARKGREAEAGEHFLEALRADPTLAEGHYNLGLSLKKRGKYREAIKRYDQALRINPDYAEAHYALGNALGEQGRTRESIRHYSAAIRLKPDYARAYDGLGRTLQADGRIEEAAEAFQKALKIEPRNIDTHLRLGELLQKTGQLEEAESHFFEAVRIQPNHARAHNNLGVVVVLQGRSGEAVGHFRRALGARPDYAEAHNNLGSALARQGQFEEACPHFSEAVRIKPDYTEARRNLKLCRSMLQGAPEAKGEAGGR